MTLSNITKLPHTSCTCLYDDFHAPIPRITERDVACPQHGDITMSEPDTLVGRITRMAEEEERGEMMEGERWSGLE